MRGFTFLLLLTTALCAGLGCTSDQWLTHQVIVETEVYPELWVDSFVQPGETEGYDILWVIDRSGSMSDHDAQLLLGIEEMLNSLPLTTSWRLGIISTDSGETLTNSTFPLVPGDDIIDANSALNALGGGWNTGGEEGFESVYSYMELGAYSSSWMRNSAALLIVFVSDEDEQSFSWTAQSFGAWLSTIRSRVLITSIVGLENGPCADQEGLAYLELTRDFNGTEIDICSEDWTQGVAEATQPFEPIEELALSRQPVVNTITIFIDGIQMPDDEWEYYEQLNTVAFLNVPSGGSLVEITYGILY